MRLAVLALLLAATAPRQAAAPPPLEPCAGLRHAEARCSTVRVPENRATRGGRIIGVRVAVLPASGPERVADPVFVLAGGPGQAATDLVGGYLSHPLRARRDIVFMDQRGTGGSNPLACDMYRAEDEGRGVFADFLPIERVRECRARLERSADLTQYTTAASVADMDDVRRALGYTRINLIGGSYGTRLALEYMRQHGAHVRSAVLDGAIAPSAAMPAGFGRAAQRALDGVLDECRATPACAAAFPDVHASARTVFASLDAAPARTRFTTPPVVEVVMTRDHVAEAIRYLTYTTRDASRVPLVLDRAARGDFGPLADSLRGRRRGSRSVVDGLYLSITCAEDVPFIPGNAAAEDRDTYLRDYRIRQQQAACLEWPRGAVPAWHRQPVTSAVPTLLVTGDLDPATPPAHAKEVARTLANSRTVIVPSAAHGLWGIDGMSCVDALRHGVIERGSVRDLDASCVAGVRRAGFAVR